MTVVACISMSQCAHWGIQVPVYMCIFSLLLNTSESLSFDWGCHHIAYMCLYYIDLAKAKSEALLGIFKNLLFEVRFSEPAILWIP